MLIILFGKAGSGKTFIGQMLALHFGFYFWDADSHLPADIQLHIKNEHSFTPAMRNKLTKMTMKTILDLQDHYPHLVIANALFKEKNRQQILTSFPKAIFVYINATPQTISMRLKLRSTGISDDYAIKINSFFEEPQLPHFVITNNEDEASVFAQCQDILNKVMFL